MRPTRLAAGALLGLLMGVSGTAWAQSSPSSGFALNRFEPSERGSSWFVTDSLDLRGTRRPAVGVVGDWAYKPLVIYDGKDNEVASVVKHQLRLHAGASLVLGNRLRLGLNLPLLLVNEGDRGQVQGVSYAASQGFAVGDLRLGADVRLFGQTDSVVTAAVGLQAHLPTGNRDAFASDGKVRLVPRALVAGQLGLFRYAAQAGVQVRTQNNNFADRPFGSEVLWAASAGVGLDRGRWVIGPELYGSTVVSDSGNGFFDRDTTPLEALLGAHGMLVPSLRAGLGAGPGLTRGFGSPQWRALASIEWQPPYEPPAERPADQDGDGIPDTQDACPTVAGVRTNNPSTNGCPPPPPDRDGDGILDSEDACPDTPGIHTQDPKTNGCPPPPDRDGDGILDSDDACPDTPGIRTQDPKTNGCPPPPDKDADGVLDSEDACPEAPGLHTPDPKTNGCPRALIVGTQIKIYERVEFDTNRATIRPESNAVLEAVLKVFKEHPEITKVNIQGHTDNRGPRPLNMQLSEKRAAAVLKWLTDHGIERSRLVSQGLGPDKPIDDNKTEAGRQNNRRVEFHILETATQQEPATK